MGYNYVSDLKILQLCLRVPIPPHDGATIAIFNLADSLQHAGAKVKMLSFNTKKHYVHEAEIPAPDSKKFSLEMVFVDASVKPILAFLNLFRKNESYNIVRFDVPAFHRKLRDILKNEKFDVVQFEGLFLSPYLNTVKKYSTATTVLRAHNVEWLIWKRLSHSAGNPLKKRYLEFLSRRLRSYEGAIVNQFDAVLALTAEDKNLLEQEGCEVPVYVVPIGLPTKKFPDISPVQLEPLLHIFHLGSMDWLPNIEGVNWFLEKVWKQVCLQTNGVIMHLAGKNMAAHYFSLANKHLMVEGEIKDAGAFMADKPIMVVPLLSGGGMRVKIIEGLAAGKVIISTRIGAEGIACENHKNILLADTPEEFAEAILGCMNHPEKLHAIAREAQLLAREKYDNTAIGENVFGIYQKKIQQKKPSP